jgi:hypothetical protein
MIIIMKLMVILLCCFLVDIHCLASPEKQKGGKSDSISWLKRIADKGHEESLKTNTKKYDFKKLFSDDVFDMDTLRKTSFEIMDTGIPSKAGYGFLMGYTSGYCLKKVRCI